MFLHLKGLMKYNKPFVNKHRHTMVTSHENDEYGWFQLLCRQDRNQLFVYSKWNRCVCVYFCIWNISKRTTYTRTEVSTPERGCLYCKNLYVYNVSSGFVTIPLCSQYVFIKREITTLIKTTGRIVSNRFTTADHCAILRFWKMDEYMEWYGRKSINCCK